ncbi:sugar phosphate nucleotidyltransferase [Halorubrum sp. ARQ200]|uniref:sugar phosphate nucleotidyltransferase n=1 Tax=Halorubrum sp. ARQ200 TaxID=1855872 RepID=UPI0010FA5802|nr:sugar phosphate nucleotidyltransferase [Halorubrum sp. ARQ200]TKX46004.1 dTDP-glucose pyrophosphorylase [Halorubrum sp. ARQ200]
MKAVIPLAGQGTRLYPQTHTKPKAMVRIAGKPILGHILSGLVKTQIEEAVLIVGGPMQTQIREYAKEEFGDKLDLTFPEQTDPQGLGHAIYQAKPEIDDEPIFITLGDMLFENGYDTFLKSHESLGAVDASLGVKQVDEPSHYGVVDIDASGKVRELVEKPSDPPSDQAISGVYVIEDSAGLFSALRYLIENNLRGAGGEFQLTDALQRMVETNSVIGTFDVEDWYDCGRPETLLEANRVLLEELETTEGDQLENTVIVPPVDMGTNVTVERSVVGPYVSLDDNTEISDSIVRSSIVGRGASLTGVNLENSIVGDAAKIRGDTQSLNVGDNSSLSL